MFLWKWVRACTRARTHTHLFVKDPRGLNLSFRHLDISPKHTSSMFFLRKRDSYVTIIHLAQPGKCSHSVNGTLIRYRYLICIRIHISSIVPITIVPFILFSQDPIKDHTLHLAGMSLYFLLKRIPELFFTFHDIDIFEESRSTILHNAPEFFVFLFPYD